MALNAPGEALAPEELRQRACTELLRQAAQRAGLLDAADAPSADGVISEAAAAAIDALLERELCRCPSRPKTPAAAITPRTQAPTAPASACACATSCSR